MHSDPKVFVGQIPSATTEEQLRALFEEFGELRSASIPKRANAPSKFGMVIFNTWTAAESAIASTNGTHKLGKEKMPLVVRFADPPRNTTNSGAAGKGTCVRRLAVSHVRAYPVLDFV